MSQVAGSGVTKARSAVEYVLSGRVGQVNHILNRQVRSGEDLSKAETDRLVEPLFDIIKRLTYEVTEIITDKPGLQLNFNTSNEASETSESSGVAVLSVFSEYFSPPHIFSCK